MYRAFRQPLWQRVVCAAALLAMAPVLLFGGLAEGGLLVGMGGGAAILLVAAAWRGWLLRVELGEDEVLVVNWLRTLRIPWREIERFGYDGGLWVRRRGGPQHVIAMHGAGGFGFAERQGERMARELEGARKRRRRQGGGRDR